MATKKKTRPAKRKPIKKTARRKRPSRSAGAQQARDDLITQYQPFVHGIVGKLIRALGLPSEHADEYVSAGYLGLVEAAERFEEGGGAEFKSFAYLRIRGAIIDAIRETTYLSSRAYRFAKALQAAHELREAKVLAEGASAGKQGVRKAPADLASVLDQVSGGALVFRMCGEGAEKVLEETETPQGNAAEQIEDHQEKQVLREWVATLPEKERLIIEEYYFNEKSFVDIASTYDGLSKSWISRLHARALEQLKERMLFQGLTPFAAEKGAAEGAPRARP